MSLPFESRSHVALRRRLMAAMGFLSGCASEAASADAGEDDAGEHEATGSALEAGAAPASEADVRQPRAWTIRGGDASTLRCQDERQHSTQCFSRDHLAWLALNGGRGHLRPGPTVADAAELETLFLPNGCTPRQYVATGCCVPPGTEATVEDGYCCYEFCETGCCGRPFIVEGKARVARAMRRADWLSSLPSLTGRPLPMPLRERAAAEWLEDARMEHASVAAFARFTLELLAFGAPADLVGESQLAGLDEIEHARMCFALASRYAGAELGPAALTMSDVAPAPNLRESVLSAVREGCIGETLAAARASAALEGTRDQTTRTVLAKIGEDETRHAELAYRYVAWALTREPTLASDIQELVRREASLFAQVPNKQDTQMDVLEPALTLLGRLSPARARATQDSTFAHVILPCIESLLRRHADALSDGSSRGPSSLKSLA